MTLLVVPVFGADVGEVQAGIKEAVDLGADAVELRIDLMGDLTDEELRAVRRSIPQGIKVILTIRSAAEGGGWEGADADRFSRFIELGPLADYIDVEQRAWRRSANIRQKVELALHRADASLHEPGSAATLDGPRRKLILSQHDQASRPTNLHADLLAMVQEPACDVAKLAWRARSVRDNFEAFELMRAGPRPLISICMGDAGLPSRVLARKFGAFASFASQAPGRATAAGQPTVSELKQLYHWDSIDAATEVYGVLGDPVAHSLSPHVHNAAFAAARRNAVYLPFLVTAGYEPFKAFMVEVLARRWLDVRGLSITIPHKENALRFLHESGAEVDPPAATIGAVNTLIVSPDGSVKGLNTDHAAALKCIQRVVGPRPGGLRGLTIAVLGAGGVARAVVAALTSAGATVTICNRTAERAAALCSRFDCGQRRWAERDRLEADLLVNCTSLGLWPDADASPIQAGALARYGAVFDTVYCPERTKLLHDAANAGCKIIGGLEMFVEQAVAQFIAWTGNAASPASFMDTARRALVQTRTG